jgi:hypothetical protein
METQCADITFTSTAHLLSGDQCKNATGVSGVALENAGSTTSNSSSTTSGSAASATASKASGAPANAVEVGAIVAGFAAVFGALLL